MAANDTFTIASLGCSIDGTSFSSTRTLYGPRYTIARIATHSPTRTTPYCGPGGLVPRPGPSTRTAAGRSADQPGHRRQRPGQHGDSGLLGDGRYEWCPLGAQPVEQRSVNASQDHPVAWPGFVVARHDRQV